jgi:hypothetical protein
MGVTWDSSDFVNRAFFEPARGPRSFDALARMCGTLAQAFRPHLGVAHLHIRPEHIHLQFKLQSLHNSSPQPVNPLCFFLNRVFFFDRVFFGPAGGPRSFDAFARMCGTLAQIFDHIWVWHTCTRTPNTCVSSLNPKIFITLLQAINPPL